MAGRAPVVPKKSKAVSLPSEQLTNELPLVEQIRLRAHEIFLQRGGQDGTELEDWLQAEEEILRLQGKDV
jgi:hypothetical protein